MLTLFRATEQLLWGTVFVIECNQSQKYSLFDLSVYLHSITGHWSGLPKSHLCVQIKYHTMNASEEDYKDISVLGARSGR